MSQPPFQQPQQPRPVGQPMQGQPMQRPPQMMGQPGPGGGGGPQQPRPGPGPGPGQPQQMMMGQPRPQQPQQIPGQPGQPRPQQPMMQGQPMQPRPQQPQMQGQPMQGQPQFQQPRPQQPMPMQPGQPMQGQGQPRPQQPMHMPMQQGQPMQGQPQMGAPQQARPMQPQQPQMQGQGQPQMGQPQQPRPQQPQQPQQYQQQQPQQAHSSQLAPPQRVASQQGQTLSPQQSGGGALPPSSARQAPSPTPTPATNGVPAPARSPSAAAPRPDRSPSQVSSRLDRREREPELRSDIKDIWQQVIEFKAEEDAKSGETSREATILFVGPKQSGKSTLIQSYMFKDKSGSVPSATTSLEYKYTRSSVGLSAAELSHFWELGGGRSLVNLLDVATTADQIKDLLAVIVVDLSKPSRVVDDLNFWIKTLRTRIDVCLASRSKDAKDSNIAATLAAEAKRQYGEKHPDINQLDLLPIPLLIIGSKYDQCRDRDTELLKILSKTLRAIAHTHGASLIYTSKDDQQQLKLFRARISRHTVKQDAPEKKTQQIEHTKAIAVPVGSDSFAKIGDAPGKTSMQGFAQAWQAIFPKYFPATPDEPADAVVESLQLQPEAYVDQELARRDEVLAQVRRDAALKRKLAVPV